MADVDDDELVVLQAGEDGIHNPHAYRIGWAVEAAKPEARDNVLLAFACDDHEIMIVLPRPAAAKLAEDLMSLMVN